MSVPFRRHRRPRRAAFRLTPVAAAFLSLGISAPAQALDLSWIGPASGGSWYDVSNWQTAGGVHAVPGASDNATFATDTTLSGGSALNLANSAALVLKGTSNSVYGILTNDGTLTLGAASDGSRLYFSAGSV
ncbi:MAG: hypothetical protein JNK22_00780, partial [Rhodocyclaceae bacterium]|nr:hypothetical protein [Rhodocyclaceae bacterium]